MKSFLRNRSAIANGIFGAAVVILIVVAAVGFGLYGTAVSKTLTSTSTVMVTATNVSTEMMTTEMMETSTVMMTGRSNSTEMMNGSSSGGAYMFTPKSGAMISSAWLLVVPTDMMNEYAVSIHAEGLEPNGTFIVEATPASGTMMEPTPISSHSMNMNTTSASEFQADRNGTANYWIVLDTNPLTTFESVQLVFLPGMSMQNATEVASFMFASSMTTESMTTG
ncbi:MAG TPA: hypothetical protein VFF30_15325 [Nitrososphaerales archaeon]|nr:hypothetical protein [Nitrososphaerales archaeon]